MRAAQVLGVDQPADALPQTPTSMKPNNDNAKLWKSLFILDSFSAALSSREPQANREDTGTPLTPGDCTPSSSVDRAERLRFNENSASTIRKTLKLVYKQSQLPIKSACEIFGQIASVSLPRRVSDAGKHDASTVASLDAVLFKHYATMLLTRPFFLQDLSSPTRKNSPDGSEAWRHLSESCVKSAHETVERIFEAQTMAETFQNDYLWRCVDIFSPTQQ